MTLQEAIEKLSDSAYGGVTTFDQDYKNALKLGIEGLKGRQQMIACGWKLLPPLLPGETKD